MKRKLLGAALLLSSASMLLADNWPQFRGPDRTDISHETGLLKQWPAGGPKQLWMINDAGLGYSGFSVVDDTLYTLGLRGDTEFLIAISVKDGKQKWATQLGPKLKNNWGDGPRGTPTVDGDHVYALSGQGSLVCASLADGKSEWKASMRDLGGNTPDWGYTESVLVDGDKVVCTPGGKQGAMAALNKKTGKVLWQSKDFTEGAQYSSIVPATINGKKQYVQLTMHKLVGIDADSGATIWSTDWPGKTAVIPTPIVHDDYVYVTAGYGVGCKLLKIDGNKATEVYSNKEMQNHHGGVVLVGEHIYGFSANEWVCQDFKTGAKVWSASGRDKDKLEKGSITCADGMLYLFGEKSGQVVLIEASPAGWKEHSRFTLKPQTTQRSKQGGIWTHPVIADGKLYLRDQELLFCFDVKGK